MKPVALSGRLSAGWMLGGRYGDFYVPARRVNAVVWDAFVLDSTHASANDDGTTVKCPHGSVLDHRLLRDGAQSCPACAAAVDESMREVFGEPAQ